MPHSEKRFVGYNRDDKSLDADTLRKFIYGGAVADYMNEMEVRCCRVAGEASVTASQPALSSAHDPCCSARATLCRFFQAGSQLRDGVTAALHCWTA